TAYNLPPSFIFPYVQLKSIIQERVLLTTQTTDNTNTERLALYDRCRTAPIRARSLSLSYAALRHTNTMPDFSFMAQWNREQTIRFPKDQWLRSILALKGITSCYSHVEAHKKLIYRWYLTPDKLNKIYPLSSAQCWRCEQDRGTMNHIWWHCPNIQPLWTEVQTICNSLGVLRGKITPEIGLFLLIPMTTPYQDRQLMIMVIMAARNLLAYHWKQKECPSSQLLHSKIRQYL
ncbi:Hypothetical predicted protein, partial [Pelobates cultripes]